MPAENVCMYKAEETIYCIFEISINSRLSETIEVIIDFKEYNTNNIIQYCIVYYICIAIIKGD